MTARLVVFVSGSGTNLQAIIDAIKKGQLDATISLVVSNRKAAYGLVRAADAGITTTYFPLKPYLEDGRGREVYDRDLAKHIQGQQTDLIVLAGWMHVLSPTFLNHFPKQVINLHPALPGAFPGTDAISRTFEAYQRGETTHGGCMVHYVIPEVDAGVVITEAVVPIEAGDTQEMFETRMHEAEHHIIVEAIQKILAK